jgi:hypothetical protein
MYNFEDKFREDNSSSSLSEHTRAPAGGVAAFQFADNRTRTIANRSLQESANHSSRTERSTQIQLMADRFSSGRELPVQRKKNETGLPDRLKTGVEHFSGYSMDDVNVHYNSNQPAQLQAHAFARGTDIHLAPGQERHLPHEAWHVVQQKQGRVKPTLQMKSGTKMNDDAGLEREADVMGKKAFRFVPNRPGSANSGGSDGGKTNSPNIVQRVVVQLVKYVKTLNGVKQVPDDYEPVWGEQFVPGPAQAPAPARVQPPAPVQAPVPVPEPTPEERGYPYGFESEKQFRDLTRPIARANRDATIVVTGSSVTGRSGDGTRPFRPKDTPYEKGNKKSGPSDIDLGIVKPGSVGKGQVDFRGFPKKKTRLAGIERRYGRNVEQTTGHPSGIKYFDSMPVEGRGRTPNRERKRIVRSHTPERLRSKEERQGKKSSKKKKKGRRY